MAKTTTFPVRYSAYAISIAGLIISLPVTLWLGGWYLIPVIFAALTALGTWDLLQRSHTVSRNYPIMANFRYLFESVGPEIRQYFIQSDTEERPFSREQRTIAYQRAKQVLDKRPFGSQLSMYEEGFEWMNHSLTPTRLDNSDFRIVIGRNCAKPYSASVFNISAMSFGSLSANAILSLNAGARKGGFYHDTGEGSISRYHREPGGDLVWEIGSGYFGCRNPDGSFNPDMFRQNATLEQVTMIEVKLSQGEKP